jgi:hypothetical protein
MVRGGDGRPRVSGIGLCNCVLSKVVERRDHVSSLRRSNSCVQQMLGHASATMTLDLYGHLFEDQLDEVTAAMDQQSCCGLNLGQLECKSPDRRKSAIRGLLGALFEYF